ncbi:hypothetical protein [Oceanidesulfovibrio marinus]|uniref:Uncharacterized protein n=1 Tax=Oceanidesulfovibrio marinus TaxID=370038 RepID=A0A6P1ZDR2_9BACT|nr:hypothetical protein [Oceanidesulfovibrio marinus]TVM31157.1 hypothetical protein DQK91_18780 [Oceanidesulfovibrio marinus]
MAGNQNLPAIADNAEDLVNSRFSQASKYASITMELAKGYIEDIDDIPLPDTDLEIPGVASPDIPDLAFSIPDIPAPQINAELPELDFPTLTLEDPFVNAPDDEFDVPVFSFTPPDIVIPQPPEIEWPDAPPDMPATNFDVDLPTAPALNLPEPPSFDMIEMPAPPTIDMPQFEGESPYDEYLDPPGDLFVYSEEQFVSELKDELEVRIRGDLSQNLLTLLPPDFHEGWWDYAEKRIEDERAQRILEAETAEASKGFTRPTGALASAIRGINLEIGRRKDELQKEILTDARAKALQHLQFIVERGLSLVQLDLEFHNQTATRAFETAKAVADYGLQVFTARVERYNALVNRYKADAEVFAERIRAMLGFIEIYKAQVEAASTKAETQKAMADVYAKQVAAATTYIELYKAQMEGAKLRTDVEHAKLEAWAKSLDGYSARLNVITSKFNAYNAQVAGEKGKAEVFAEQVRAYTAQVTAAATGEEMRWKDVEMRIRANESRISEAKAKSDLETAELNAAVARVGADADMYRTYVAALEASAKGTAAVTESKADIYKSKATAAISYAELLMRNSEAQKQLAINKAQVLLAAREAAARAASALAQGAMAGVNASASFSFSGQQSLSSSYSDSFSVQKIISEE